MKMTSKWRANSKSRKPKPHIRTPRIQWQQLGLTDPSKQATSIEEIRRQVLLASSRGIGHAARSQSEDQPAASASLPPESTPKRPRRRGATE